MKKQEKQENPFVVFVYCTRFTKKQRERHGANPVNLTIQYQSAGPIQFIIGYQLAFLTPGSSPARACIRNWN
jgi:hypothetical protein